MASLDVVTGFEKPKSRQSRVICTKFGNHNPIAMPIATAVWLVENTALTFGQIGEFCGIHAMDVAAIANETMAKNVIGINPLGIYVDPEEIERCEKDPDLRISLMSHILSGAEIRIPKVKQYTSVSQRRNKPDAILWIINFAPMLSNRQIIKLVRTTESTIDAIRNGTYSNISTLVPKDPVTVGLCSQRDLDTAIELAKSRALPADISQHDNQED